MALLFEKENQNNNFWYFCLSNTNVMESKLGANFFLFDSIKSRTNYQLLTNFNLNYADIYSINGQLIKGITMIWVGIASV